jgi:hypothetical protein
MLPRFLIADNSLDQPDKLYVVCTQSPRFILEGDMEDFTQNQKFHWLEDHNLTNDQIAELADEAEDFLDAELTNQEFLNDEDEDDEE